MYGRVHSMSSGGVVGLRATPASQPPERIRPSVRCRWVALSGWTQMLATPASMNWGIRLSGLVIWRWASMGRSTAAASEAATAGPTVRLGTRWLSITSKWTRLAPPPLALRTSSARFAKSAASIEGAPTTLSPSCPKNVKGSPSRGTAAEKRILQKAKRDNSETCLSSRAVLGYLFGKLVEVDRVKVIPDARRIDEGEAGETVE